MSELQKQIKMQLEGSSFEELLKAGGVDINKFKANALMAIANNEDIANGLVTQQSVFNVCQRAAQDGLMLDGKEAAIVIGSAKVNNIYVKVAQYRLMVAGKIKQIYRSSTIKRLFTAVIYENDLCDINLTPDADVNPVIHKINVKAERGTIIGAYAYCQLTTGEYTSPEFMTSRQIEGIKKNYSKAGDSGMWKNTPEEAYIKTVLHRASKRLPLDVPVNLIDDEYEIIENAINDNPVLSNEQAIELDELVNKTALKKALLERYKIETLMELPLTAYELVKNQLLHDIKKQEALRIEQEKISVDEVKNDNL